MKYLLILLLLVGCSNDRSKVVKLNMETTCLDGIVYFVTYSNNIYYGNDISSVKIDAKTLKPMICK